MKNKNTLIVELKDAQGFRFCNTCRKHSFQMDSMYACVLWGCKFDNIVPSLGSGLYKRARQIRSEGHNDLMGKIKKISSGFFF